MAYGYATPTSWSELVPEAAAGATATGGWDYTGASPGAGSSYGSGADWKKLLQMAGPMLQGMRSQAPGAPMTPLAAPGVVAGNPGAIQGLLDAMRQIPQRGPGLPPGLLG